MRDGLSLLDQALAFGDGSVSAERVREALGLIADETYSELLTLVSERRPEGIFPFVARLVEAGADLGEFVNGLGEVLRALMVRQLGGEPEGLTDALRVAVDASAARLPVGDALRMLHLLQEAEAGIRRGANARLHVESLLLRFALLDRTVDLRDVLAALGPAGWGAGPGPAPAARPAAATGAPSRTRRGDVMRDAAGTDAATSPREGPPPDAVALRSRWTEVVEAIRGRRPLVAAALEHAAPVDVEGMTVTLGVSESEVHLEGLERSRAEVETGLAAVFGARLRVVYRPAGPGAEAEARTAEPRRLDPQGDRGERLRAYRAKDQALDAMADALDLELLD
jgi:DNA polymerase-3 subunit gamma/tau